MVQCGLIGPGERPSEMDKRLAQRILKDLRGAPTTRALAQQLTHIYKRQRPNMEAPPAPEITF